MAVLESRLGADFEPIASRTRLGWVVRGVVGADVNPLVSTHTAFLAHAGQATTELDVAFRRFCDTEAFGSEHKASCVPLQHQQAIDELDRGIRRLDVGYEAPVLWKEGEPTLEDNRQLAEMRLRSLTSKFR